jgi:CxxC motif-containing protein (DUF1111 family)
MPKNLKGRATMMKRCMIWTILPVGAVFAVGAVLAALITSPQAFADPAPRDNQGRGVVEVPVEAAVERPTAPSTAVYDTSRNAFGRPLVHMRRELWQPFRQGKRFFARPRAETPGGTLGVLGGLGPLMNARSCSDCHFKDGRGGRGATEPRLLVRLSVETSEETGPEPTYGAQLQDQSLPGVSAEGQLEVHWERVEGHYGDGESYRLRRPTYRLSELAYGPPVADLKISPRMPPALVGLGLLEAVADQEILAWVDVDDRDGDGISGRANRVPDRRGGGIALGRFGWKAGQPTLEQQNAAALAQDLGVTSELHPESLCTAAQPDCLDRSVGGAVEATAHEIQRLTLYTRLLAVPARRDEKNLEVGRGRSFFHQIGCGRCHRSHMVTGAEAELPELRLQEIQPYSDLLLHDLGEELADGRSEHQATGREWRTPPLWGLGLLQSVSGTVRLLHDGRARSAEEAILWHGGEAMASREIFRQAGAEERRSLLLFLNSL